MMMNGFQRGATAFVVSVAWNFTLFLISLLDLDPVKHPTLDKFFDAAFWPGESVAQIFIAPGHEFAQLVGMLFLALFFSIAFYCLLVWIILSLPMWWQDRHGWSGF